MQDDIAADLQTNKLSSQWRPAEVTSHFGP